MVSADHEGLHYAVYSTPQLPRPSFLSILLLNTLSLFSPLNVRDQVLHSYTTGEIMVLYVLIVIFLNNKLEDKRFLTE